MTNLDQPDTTQTDRHPSAAGHGHATHWLVCAVAAFVALMLALRLGSPFAAGVAVAALLCPLAMAFVVWLLLRSAPPGHRG